MTAKPNVSEPGENRSRRPYLITVDLGSYHYDLMVRIASVLQAKSSAGEWVNKTDTVRFALESAAIALGVSK